MFKIGDFARLNKVTVKTLRHYDSIGLLQPEKIDSFTGYRYYSASQMLKLNRILSLKDIGFSLEEIAVVLNKNVPSEQMQTILEVKRAEISAKLASEQSRLSRIENYLKTCKQEAYIMKYDIVLKSVEPIRVASLRNFIPSYSEQGHLWDELASYINKNGAKIVPPCMVIYYNGGKNESSIDAEVIEPIEGNLKSNERIKVRELEKVSEMACVVHKGPYSNLYMAYSAITQWIEDNNYEIISPNRELYIRGELNSSSQDEYITELQFPVRKLHK